MFIEFIRFSLGIVVLWAPLGGLFYILLEEQVPDRIVRFTFSAIASYTLTTLAFFGLAVLQLDLLFYLGQIGLIGWGLVYVTRKKLWGQWVKPTWSTGFRQLDWILITLIAVSLIANIPYKDFFDIKISPDTGTKTYTYQLSTDYLGHAGWAYELDRHTPNIQTPFRAGTPDRAYHHFSNVTTMLLARFTFQSDMLRAHIVYHYTIIEILICLALFSLAKTLTKSRWAGYLAVSLMYFLIISWPPLLLQFIDPQTIHPVPAVYFTLFPHVSSGLDVVALTSSQMYSGLTVMYGILLGILLISVRVYDNSRADILLIITALMVAATMRFRVHIFLAMLPGFLLIMAYLSWQKRKAIYPLAGGLALFVSVLLYLEMRSSIYLPGTTSLYLGYNKLTEYPAYPYNSWPFAFEIHQWLRGIISNPQILNWVWQIISMPTFVSLNIIGISLLIATGIYLSTKSARQEFILFSIVCLCSVVITTIGAIAITSDYDSYSVGGQLPHHTRWYLFPLMSVAIWLGYQYLQSRLHWPQSAWISHGVILLIFFTIGRQLTLPSNFMSMLFASNIVLSEDHRLALSYLHEHTPQDAVIISNNDTSPFIFSGLAGRADYAGDPYDTMEEIALQLNPKDNRRERISELWVTANEEHFCARLYPTLATHLVEYTNQPLQVDEPACLQRIWQSPQKEVSIWQVDHSYPATLDTYQQPILIEENIGEFNIFLYQDQYFALPSDVEVSDTTWHQNASDFITRNYLAEIKQLVDLEPDFNQTVSFSSSHEALGSLDLLFDGGDEPGHAWHSRQNPEFPQWIDIIFSQPVILKTLSLQAQFGGPSNRDRAPQNVIIFGGNSSDLDQYEVPLQFNFAQAGDWSFQKLPRPGKMLQHYRILILDNHGQLDFVTIQELWMWVLVEENYKGFNIFWNQGKFYVLAQHLETLDATQLNKVSLTEYKTFCAESDQCGITDSLDAAKKFVDQHY